MEARSLTLYLAVAMLSLGLLALVLLCCFYCSRKYRLNWFERSVLENLSHRHDSEKDFLQCHNKLHSDIDGYEENKAVTQNKLDINKTGRNKNCGNKLYKESYTPAKTTNTGSSNNQQGLPRITIGPCGANVVTRKVKQSPFIAHSHTTKRSCTDACSMGSTTSTPDDSSVSSEGSANGSHGDVKHVTMTSQSQKSTQRNNSGDRNNTDDKIHHKIGYGSTGNKHGNQATTTGSGSVYTCTRRASNATAPLILPVAQTTGNRKGSMSGSTGSGSDSARRDSAEFWVPPTVLHRKRAQSLVPSLGLAQQDDHKPPRNISPTMLENTSSQSDIVFEESLLEKQSLVEIGSQVPQRARRRASMQDALDPALINARIYAEMQCHRPRDGSIGSIQEEDIGVMNLDLEYSEEQAILKVKLIAARGLIPRDFSGTSDPYCRVQLLPSRNKDAKLQTKVHKNTQNPNFDEEFMFNVQPKSLDKQTLQVLLFDFDQFSRDECVGQVLIPLSSVDLSEKQTLWRSINTYESIDETEDCGDVMFSLGYLPSAERLTVVLLKARNLSIPGDISAKSAPNPFVKVSIISNDKRIKKKKTATVRNNGNPVWNEALVFNINKTLLKTISMDITLYSDNVIGNNEILGHVLIGSDSLGDERGHWNDMLNSKTALARWHKLTYVQ